MNYKSLQKQAKTLGFSLTKERGREYYKLTRDDETYCGAADLGHIQQYLKYNAPEFNFKGMSDRLPS